MNAHVKAEHESLALVEIIDLKWLLAREGHHIHVERMQANAAYAQECILLAARSPHLATRQVAERLQQRLAPGRLPA